MVRSIRSPRRAPTTAGWLAVICVLLSAGHPKTRAEDPPSPTSPPPANSAPSQTEAPTKPDDAGSANPQDKEAQAAPSLEADLKEKFSLSGEDAPSPFVPQTPRTVEDQREIDAVRLYSAARALEDQRRWTEAATFLEEALKLDPESVAIPRRLSRLYVGPLARPDLAMKFGKQVLAIEPGDTETLLHLVDYFNQKNDAAGAEAILKDTLANPKLDAHAPARLLANFELGRLYSGPLPQIDQAADAFAKVLDALDDPSANRLSSQELSRVLGNDPAGGYLSLGMVFLAAKKPDLAIKAFERGLLYDDDNPQICLILSDALLSQGKGDKALALVERFLKRQPQGVEGYELLAKILKGLHREDEITTRLEEAARKDSKNVPLQYVLADRYRETGQVEKAEELYKSLLSTQPTPETYRALTASLLKRKKLDELLRVICEAITRPRGLDAVSPQLQTIASDDEAAQAMLDAGLKMLSAKPAELPAGPASKILRFIANADRAGDDRTKRLEKLIAIDQLLLDQNPSPDAYREVAETQRQLGKFADAAATLEQMMAKHPGEKSVRSLMIVAEFQRQAGSLDAARATAAEALKLAPPDAESQVQLAYLLSQTGQVDEAVALLRKAIQNEPASPLPEITLGDVLTQFGRNAEAVELFRDMLKRYPNNDEIARIAHSRLSVIYVNQGDYSNGESELEILYERNPDEPGVNNDLGYLYAEQGKNLEKAESMIRKALQEDPENYAYLDSLGWVLFKRGKVQEALESLQKAVEKLERPDPTIFEHLGDVYLKLQESGQAKLAWEKAEQAAIKAVPQDRRLAEIRKKLDSLNKLDPAPKPSTDQTP